MNNASVYRLFISLVSLIPAGSYADDIERGEVLHLEHCQRCHQSEVYTRPERIIKNLVQLRQRVKQCELANDLLWFDEEVSDVTAYLNAHYYLFDINK